MNDQTRTDFDETNLDEAERAGAFVGNTLSEQDTTASREDPVDTSMPVFIEDDQYLEPPAFVTRSNARQLFGMQPSESLEDALARLERQREIAAQRKR